MSVVGVVGLDNKEPKRRNPNKLTRKRKEVNKNNKKLKLKRGNQTLTCAPRRKKTKDYKMQLGEKTCLEFIISAKSPIVIPKKSG